MLKNLIIATAFSVAATAVHAGYSCEAYSYGNGLNATSGSIKEQKEIIRSWIPENFSVDETVLQFDDWDPIKVRSYSDQKIRATVKLEDDSGEDHNVTYELLVKDNASIGSLRMHVTMRERGYKPLGPVVFDCTRS